MSEKNRAAGNAPFSESTRRTSSSGSSWSSPAAAGVAAVPSSLRYFRISPRLKFLMWKRSSTPRSGAFRPMRSMPLCGVA
jgi:hypothetical protein